ncbi:MAG: sodium:proton antiporter [Methanosarcinaceae archaeon]|nr:sodium:proton antiporter [Methanosarcinaceae archaeon]MDF1533463.1 sodium:proton antiporter [Methanosarcinaceae archaeon]
MDKIILENVKYLNDSVIAILLLMPVTLVITFEALDPIPELKNLSIFTWIVYLLGLWYVAYRVYNLNKNLAKYMEEE